MNEPINFIKANRDIISGNSEDQLASSIFDLLEAALDLQLSLMSQGLHERAADIAEQVVELISQAAQAGGNGLELSQQIGRIKDKQGLLAMTCDDLRQQKLDAGDSLRRGQMATRVYKVNNY